MREGATPRCRLEQWGRRPWVRALTALLVSGATACGSDPASPPATPLPTLPESALVGYAMQTQVLDAAAIAAEVADPDAVAAALEGMRSATERRFSSHREPEQQVIARTIRFASASQATEYIGWLEQHAADVLGAGPHNETVELAGAVAYSHDPNGCCPGKEMVWWLVAWARGTDALVLMVGGTQVRSGVVESLATSLDSEVAADLRRAGRSAAPPPGAE